MRLHSHLNSAARIIGHYDGEQPFSIFLRKYFSADKKFGSKDRKQIGHLCYCFFRLGKALTELPTDERILIGLFLCSIEPNEILEAMRPKWNLFVRVPIYQKLSAINHSLLINDVFPWKEELSEEINYEVFCKSFLIQPNLYLRIRPGYEHRVKDRVAAAGIHFDEMEARCLSLSNATKVENVVDLDREAVVQDYNSQKTAEYIKSAMLNLKSKISAWDCCAGSGGKSLLLHDLDPAVALAVSDVRPSIITQLKKRFSKAGIKKYSSFIADLTTRFSPRGAIGPSPFDLIICDVPCTGSGTWSRTPEQLYFFDDKKIGHYVSLQKRITSNVIPHLNPGGFLLYITCSVFKKENQQLVHFIGRQFRLELIKMELLQGYDKKADTLFVALFRKSS